MREHSTDNDYVVNNYATNSYKKSSYVKGYHKAGNYRGKNYYINNNVVQNDGQNDLVQHFLEMYVKKIVKHPDEVSVETSKGKHSDYKLLIKVAKEDAGKVIGKDGKMISSLKNVVSACKAKNNVSYELEVISDYDL